MSDGEFWGWFIVCLLVAATLLTVAGAMLIDWWDRRVR